MTLESLNRKLKRDLERLIDLQVIHHPYVRKNSHEKDFMECEGVGDSTPAATSEISQLSGKKKKNSMSLQPNCQLDMGSSHPSSSKSGDVTTPDLKKNKAHPDIDVTQSDTAGF